MSESELLEFLYSALHSESGCGTIITTEDPEFVRQKLYPLRKRDPDLACLAFVIPPEPNQLWIVKRQEKQDASQEPS